MVLISSCPPKLLCAEAFSAFYYPEMLLISSWARTSQHDMGWILLQIPEAVLYKNKLNLFWHLKPQWFDKAYSPVYELVIIPVC